MRDVRVLKFGGSSFLSPADYNAIAAYLEERLHRDSSRLVVVVSAGSGTTGRLLEAMLKVNPSPPPATLDGVLATGEMVSAGLLEAALEGRGVPALSLTGFTLGMRSDDTFTRARIEDIDLTAIRSAFAARRVVVASGGQALAASGRLAMLGRNSSDLTAVALAGALRLSECEIFSDVPGVYTADPYLVPSASLLPEISFEAAATMSRHGAKVLHHGAVEHAARCGVRILCRALRPQEITGTVIGRGDFPAVVVTNARCRVLSYASDGTRDRAMRELLTRGIVGVKTVRQEMPALAIVDQSPTAERELADAGLPALRLDENALIVVFDPARGRRTMLTERDNAGATARRLHAALYPAVTDGVACATPTTPDKPRSSLSKVLLGTAGEAV
jgi:aspartate kinase